MKTLKWIASQLATNPDVQAPELGPPLSHLESRFAFAWRTLDGPELLTEHRFHPTRMWRFDFAHPPSRIAIEIEGGTRTQGRHTRHTGFKADCEKYNAAALLGWRVIRLTADMIDHDNLAPILAAILDTTHDI